MPRCFVIAPIGEAESETRKRSDTVLRHIIRPVLKHPERYKVVSADEIAEPGLITNQIVERLRDDELVIADLTDANPNVFYALAIRNCVKKPVIHLLLTGQKPPFDLGNSRTIFYDLTLEGGERCKEELEKHITAVESDSSNVSSPVSNVIDLVARSGENPWNGIEELLLLIQDDVKTLGFDLRSRIARIVNFLGELPLGQLGAGLGLLSSRPSLGDVPPAALAHFSDVMNIPPVFKPEQPIAGEQPGKKNQKKSL